MKNVCDKKIKSHKRNMGKLEKHIEVEIEKTLRKISQIIIDGNNLCYDRHGNFIRVSPLFAVINAVASSIDIKLFFDSDIRLLLKLNNEKIKELFQEKTSKKLIIHIVDEGEKADAYLLHSAAYSKEIYILSNDRFNAFNDFAAVAEKRVIRHFIDPPHITIIDLNINVPFTEDATSSLEEENIIFFRKKRGYYE